MNVKKSYRYLLIALFLMLLVGCGDKKISGEVRDIFNNPLEGVVVSIANSAFEATTDEDGKYSIDYVPGDIELLFKHKEYISGNLKINLSVKEDFPAKQVFLYPSAQKTGMYVINKDKKTLTWLKNEDEYTDKKFIPYIKSGKNSFVLYMEDSKDYSVKDFILIDKKKVEERAKASQGSGWSAMNAMFMDNTFTDASNYNLKITKIDKHNLLLNLDIPNNKIMSWKIGSSRSMGRNYGGMKISPIFQTTSDMEKIERQNICSAILENKDDDKTIEFLKSIKDKESKFCSSVYGTKISLYEYANIHNVSENIKKLLPKEDVKNYSYESDEDVKRLLSKFFNKIVNKQAFVIKLLDRSILSMEQKKDFIAKLEKIQKSIHGKDADDYQNNIDMALLFLYSNVFDKKYVLNYIENGKYHSFSKKFKDEIKNEINSVMVMGAKFSEIVTIMKSINDKQIKEKIIRHVFEDSNRFSFEEKKKLLSYLADKNSFPFKIKMADLYIQAGEIEELKNAVEKEIDRESREGKDYLKNNNIVAGLIYTGQFERTKYRFKKRYPFLDELDDALVSYYIMSRSFNKIDKIYQKYSRNRTFRVFQSAVAEKIYKKAAKYGEFEFAKKYYEMLNKTKSSSKDYNKNILYNMKVEALNSLYLNDSNLIRSSFASYFSRLRNEGEEPQSVILIPTLLKIEDIYKGKDAKKIKREILYEVELILDGLEDAKVPEFKDKVAFSKETETKYNPSVSNTDTKKYEKSVEVKKINKGNNLIYDGKIDIKNTSTDKVKSKKAFWANVKTIAALKGDAVAGEATFAMCAGCHMDGAANMGGVTPPSLDHAGTIYDKNFLIALIKDPAMATNVDHKYPNGTMTHPMGSISSMVSAPQDIANVVAYIKAKKAGYVTAKEAFTEACGRCHNFKDSEKNLIKNYMGKLPSRDLSTITKQKSEDYLRIFIENPQLMIKGTSMPRVGLNYKGMDKVIEYLNEIKNNVETTKEVKSKNKPFTHSYKSKYGYISITAKRLEDRLVELDISMTNNSNYDWGWLSVSFPNLQSKSSVKGSEKIGFVTVKSYGQGSKIYNKNLKKSMISDYLLVEGEGKKWQKNSVKSMKILVKSQTENGEMIVNVRGSFKPKKGKAVAFPSSDENGVVIGQQGYENYRILVP